MELGTFQNLCMRHIENAKDQLMKKWVINVIWYVYVNHIRERNLKKLNWGLKELQYLELRRKKKMILPEFPDESLNIL